MPPHRPAVVDYSSVKQEPWLVELLKKLDTPRFKLDKSLTKELKGISRRAREKYTEAGEPRLPVVRNKQDMTTLMQENAQCLADRDRVVEILVSYTAIKYGLDAIWEQAEGLLLANPTFQTLSNIPARTAFTNELLRPLADKMAEIKKVIALCEVLKEHLSHTHFAIKQQADMGHTVLNFRSA